MKPSAFRRVLQAAAFTRKEAIDILRQPRLLLTLVLGPFLIMAVFGLGYRDTPERMRTVFVAPSGSPLLDEAEKYADDTGPYVEFVGVSNDAAEVRRRLVEGEIDLIVSFPDDPLSTVLDGEQASITVIHTRLDPIERTAIDFASRLAIDEINGQILAEIVEGGQGLARPAAEAFSIANTAISTLDESLSTQDQASAEAALAELEESSARLALAVRTLDSLSERLVGEGAIATEGVVAAVADVRAAVVDLRANLSAQDIDERLSRISDLLATVNRDYDRLTSADPGVLVQPFRSVVELAVDDVGKVTDWYAPAAVVLMLQQFGVAFGALTFVRERQLGIIDIFRVAPINAAETLLGKYVAYLLIGCGVGAILTVLVVTALDVPVAAGIGEIAVVMALTLFASIGLGFVISLASANDAQAVQYTLLLLLASLFFSGFFLSVGQLEGVARYVSWLLPVTYGMQLLRDVMLRGASPDSLLIGGLAAYGLAMFVLALLGTRRRLAVI
ncbi:MAG: ABC transporter permease [Actinobacteria bacterium]|nr:MAG: ABC transporter permease [Actinomycetota bacterium]